MLHANLRSLCHGLLCLITPPRVWIVVYPRMPRQFVRSGETLRTAGKLTGVWLLAGVSSNMSGLMLETVKGLIAQRTLVGTRQILTVFSMDSPVHLGHHTDGGHLCFSLGLLGGVDLC